VSLTDRLAVRPPPQPALRALLRLRARLRRWREGVVPPYAAMIERAFALIEARALGIAAELDLADLVEARPRTSAELAEATQTDADALDRLLQLLAATGCFRRGRDGRWRNNRLSSTLRSEHPFSVRAFTRFICGRDHLRIWAEAEHAVRTGGSATRVATGQEFFEWAHAGDPEFGRRFDAAMRDGSNGVARSFAEIVDLHGARTVCDVGGGTGTLLAVLLARHPHLRGVLYDLPEVVVRSAGVLEGAGVDGRVEVVAGSFFEQVPAADRIVLVSIVHDWDGERACEILRRCRAALPPTGRLLVVEPVLDPTRPPFVERHTDLLMLVLTGAGRERTDAQLRALFAAAGLRVTRTWLLATMQTVFELEPTPRPAD
jgi:hypothetical protein